MWPTICRPYTHMAEIPRNPFEFCFWTAARGEPEHGGDRGVTADTGFEGRCERDESPLTRRRSRGYREIHNWICHCQRSSPESTLRIRLISPA